MISLSLTYALPIASILNGLLTSSAETEQELVAVERTLRYTDHVPAEVYWSLRQATPALAMLWRTIAAAGWNRHTTHAGRRTMVLLHQKATT